MLPGMEQHELSELPARLSLRQVSDLMRIPRRHLLLAAATGSLPVRRRGWRLVVPAAELLVGFGLAPFRPEDHDHDRR